MGAISKNIKVIMVVIALIVIGYIGFTYITEDAPANPDIGLSAEAVGENSEIGRRLIATLDTISAINLDRSLLTSTIFTSLQDLSTEITPQPVGRDNPFSPTRAPARQIPPTTRR
jgi:hypothetical protein